MDKLETDVLRNLPLPTQNMYFNSDHPMEITLIYFRFFVKRMHHIPLTPQSKNQEKDTIKQTAQNNVFPKIIIT
jgi:hypothetical protein